MTPLLRYTLIQIPSWLLLAGLLWWAISSEWIQLSTAAWIMIIWILKDAALYPLCKPGFETGPAIGARALIGREARVITTLAPQGQIKLDGEYWSARTHGNGPIASGEHIRIIGAEGLVLIVEPAA